MGLTMLEWMYIFGKLIHGNGSFSCWSDIIIFWYDIIIFWYVQFYTNKYMLSCLIHETYAYHCFYINT